MDILTAGQTDGSRSELAGPPLRAAIDREMKFTVERAAFMKMMRPVGLRAPDRARKDADIRVAACEARVFLEANDCIGGVEALAVFMVAELRIGFRLVLPSIGLIGANAE